jgi:hypothetical protein
VWGLLIEGSVRSIVIIGVLALAKLITELVDVVGNAVVVQEPIELLLIDGRSGQRSSAHDWPPAAASVAMLGLDSVQSWSWALYSWVEKGARMSP